MIIYTKGQSNNNTYKQKNFKTAAVWKQLVSKHKNYLLQAKENEWIILCSNDGLRKSVIFKAMRHNRHNGKTKKNSTMPK